MAIEIKVRLLTQFFWVFGKYNVKRNRLFCFRLMLLICGNQNDTTVNREILFDRNVTSRIVYIGKSTIMIHIVFKIQFTMIGRDD